MGLGSDIDGCLQNCVPPMKPRGGTAENRRSWRRVVRSQDLRRSVDPRSTGRHSEVLNGLVRRAGREEPPKTILPSSPTFGTSVGLGVNTGSTRSHLEQASVKATTLHTYQQHYAKWMRLCRQSQKNLSTPTSLEMAMIQYFDHLFFKGSPSGICRAVLASVCHCRPDWALCLRSDVGRIKKALKGWERLAPGNSKDPLPLIFVLSHRRSTSTATSRCQRRRSWPPMRIYVQDAGKRGRLSIPRRRDCEQNPAARRHNHIGFVKPPVVGTAGQPDCPDSKEGRKAVLLHHRCVAQGTAGCGSEAAGGILRHHAACDAPFRAEQRQGVTLQDNRRSPEAGQVARLNVSSPLRKVSTSLTVGGRSSGAGPCQDSGARSKSTCEPDASNPQRARPEACTAQTFAKRCRGSPHFQALKGRTSVVLMDAGAPFAKALRCFGLVVHSCPLETRRMPQARDRINRVCRESSFVVCATLPLTYIDGILAVRNSHGKPWPDTSSRTVKSFSPIQQYFFEKWQRRKQSLR